MTSKAPSASLALLDKSALILQGAEAASRVVLSWIIFPLILKQKVYKATLHPEECSKGTDPVPVLLKYRFKKQYRHPSLDASLTRSRVAGEARALMKCLRCVLANQFVKCRWQPSTSFYRSGVNVPGIRMVDAVAGIIGIEWIEGKSVRYLLPGGAEEEVDEICVDEEIPEGDEPLREYGISQGRAVCSWGVEQVAYIFSTQKR